MIDGKGQFLLMAGIPTVIFFRSPWSLGSGGGWINDGVHIYIFLVLLPFFSVNFHRNIRCAMAGIMVALSLWHLGYSVRDCYYLNREIADFASEKQNPMRVYGAAEKRQSLICSRTTGRPR